MKREAYLKAADNLRRMQSSTARSLFEYLASLKSAYSKIMVMRLDLHFPWQSRGRLCNDRAGTSAVGSPAALCESSFKSFLGYAANSR